MVNNFIFEVILDFQSTPFTFSRTFRDIITPPMKLFLPLVLALSAFGQSRAEAPRIYIQPQEGFESYISAAIVKKKVPAVVTQNKQDATFILTSAVDAKTESTGSKVARCLFLYCAGMEGNQTATVQLVNSKNEVAWAYNVKKGSARAYQSTAEAIAKHLKRYLESQHH